MPTRLTSVTIIPLVAVICCALAGSAAAASGVYPPTVLGGFPPQIGVPALTADLNLNALPGDSIAWETCGAQQLGDLVTPTSSAYTLSSSDIGHELCALELDVTDLVDGISDPVGPVGLAPTLSAAGAPLTEGDTVSVTQGAWGDGASAPTDVWEDCDANGANCQPVVPSATGLSYTVTRSDVGSTIAVQETATAADGVTTASVTTAPTGVVSATAPVLDIKDPPTVSGTPLIGDTLTASPGAWSNDPTSYIYQWVGCSSGVCTPIQGATSSTYVPVAADLGNELEVDVAGVVDAGEP
jgi:hypothetical protein